MEARNNETEDGTEGSSFIDMTNVEIVTLHYLLRAERLDKEMEETNGEKIMGKLAKADYVKDHRSPDAYAKYSSYLATARLMSERFDERSRAAHEREDALWEVAARLEPGETAR